MSQASIWALDQPSKLQSLLRSSLEAAEDHDRDYCETNFQNRQFLSYWHVIYIKKILRSYWLQILNKNFILLQKNMILDRFFEKSSFFEFEKNLAFNFFEETSKNPEKWLYQRKVEMLIVKVMKFGVIWYIPLEMTAKSAGGGVPSPQY